MNEIDALINLVEAERRLRQSPYKETPVITNKEAHLERLKAFARAWEETPSCLRQRIMDQNAQA